MDDRLTKLQWTFLEDRIQDQLDGKSVAHKERLIAERDEIIDLYDIGTIERQRFLLDYKGLSDSFRQQLALGLPLSKKQEDCVYQALDIEDQALLVSRRDMLRKMSREQLTRLNSLTTEGRRTIIARLVDGRILGVLDQVLEAAPEAFVDNGRHTEIGHNRLAARLIEVFQRDGSMKPEQRITSNYDAIVKLIKLVDSGVVEGAVLVKVAGELLNQEQREYWRGHTSGSQKLELSKYILLDMNKVALASIKGHKNIPKNIMGQVTLGIPLTNRQYSKLQEYLKH